MNKAKDILKFNYSPESLSASADNIITASLSNIAKIRISNLQQITKKLGQNELEQKPTEDMKEIFLMFKAWFQEKRGAINFGRRELRILTYALDYQAEGEKAIFGSEAELKQVLDLLDLNWKDYYIPGLLRCYLMNWKKRNPESFNLLGSFIFDKLDNYRGSRRLHMSLKSNIKYFDSKKGDFELGSMLALKNIPLTEVTAFLSVPDQWVTYSYFTRVIEGYLERVKGKLEQHLGVIQETLSAHSGHTKGTMANKILISKIIIYTSNSNEQLQDRVKDVAFNLIGDPGVTNNWRAFEGTSNEDVELISRARSILNQWITRQFISVFFEKCINDKRRKQFWLKYSKKISKFKVFGPKSIKRELKRDERIGKYVEGRFQHVGSKRNISAFLFSMENHKLIEFSDPGYAFYAYKESNMMAPQFETKNLGSVDGFRNGSMPLLAYRTGYHIHHLSEEGRLGHKDGDLPWEHVFEHWLTKKVGINV